MVSLRVCGLIRPFSTPSGSMSPALKQGDHFFVERFSFLLRKPARGDIVTFKPDNIPSLRPSTMYLKRIAGCPGEHVKILNSKLYINGLPVTI
jgi:signal peptidase I